jgi:hypothetical protein
VGHGSVAEHSPSTPKALLHNIKIKTKLLNSVGKIRENDHAQTKSCLECKLQSFQGQFSSTNQKFTLSCLTQQYFKELIIQKALKRSKVFEVTTGN